MLVAYVFCFPMYFLPDLFRFCVSQVLFQPLFFKLGSSALTSRRFFTSWFVNVVLVPAGHACLRLPRARLQYIYIMHTYK